jgi:hypothetical protein
MDIVGFLAEFPAASARAAMGAIVEIYTPGARTVLMGATEEPGSAEWRVERLFKGQQGVLVDLHTCGGHRVQIWTNSRGTVDIVVLGLDVSERFYEDANAYAERVGVLVTYARLQPLTERVAARW